MLATASILALAALVSNPLPLRIPLARCSPLRMDGTEEVGAAMEPMISAVRVRPCVPHSLTKRVARAAGSPA